MSKEVNGKNLNKEWVLEEIDIMIKKGFNKKQIIEEMKKKAIKKLIKERLYEALLEKDAFSNDDIDNVINTAINNELPMLSVCAIQSDEKAMTAFCGKCGYCCKTCYPIRLYELDIQDMSQYLGVSLSEFCETYVISKEGKYYLKNGPPCEFLDENNRCKIYPVRPAVCKNYPFNKDRLPLHVFNPCMVVVNFFMNITIAFLLEKFDTVTQDVKDELKNRAELFRTKFFREMGDALKEEGYSNEEIPLILAKFMVASSEEALTLAFVRLKDADKDDFKLINNKKNDV